MKKFKLLSFIIWALILVACSGKKQEQTSVYSFHGENKCIAVLNGSITMNSGEEVFDGGKLELIQKDLFKKVVSYSTSFYTMKNDEQRIIMSNSVIDQTGNSICIEGDLGKISGESVLIGNKIESIEELHENLWFELKTFDVYGMETVYRVQLTLTQTSI